MSSADDPSAGRLLDLLFAGLENLSPAIKNVVLYAKSYHKALTAVTAEASRFFEQLHQIGQNASEFRSATRHVGNALKEISEVYRQIELQRLEMLRSLLEDFILPLESRHGSEAKALALLQKGYREDRHLRLQIVEKAEQDLARHRKKHRKQAQSDFDIREDQLQTQVQDRIYELGQVRNTSLRKVLLHERKVYCFLLEYSCAFMRADSSHHGRAHTALQRKLNDWLALCNNPHHLPEETEQLIRNPSVASQPRWLSGEDRPMYLEDEMPLSATGIGNDSDNESWEQPGEHLANDHLHSLNHARGQTSVGDVSPESQAQSDPRRPLRHMDSMKRPLPDPPSTAPPSLPGEEHSQPQVAVQARPSAVPAQPAPVGQLQQSGHWQQSSFDAQPPAPQPVTGQPSNPTPVPAPTAAPPPVNQPDWSQMRPSQSTPHMEQHQQPPQWQQPQQAPNQPSWNSQGNWQWQGQGPAPQGQPPGAQVSQFPTSHSAGSFGQIGYDKPSPAFVQQTNQGGYPPPQHQQQHQWPYVPPAHSHHRRPNTQEPHYEEPDRVHHGRRGRHRYDHDKDGSDGRKGRRHRSHSRGHRHRYSSDEFDDSDRERRHRRSSSGGRRRRSYSEESSPDDSPPRHRRNRSRERGPDDLPPRYRRNRSRERGRGPDRDNSPERSRHRSTSRKRRKRSKEDYSPRRRELERDLSPRVRGHDRDLSPPQRKLERDHSPKERTRSNTDDKSSKPEADQGSKPKARGKGARFKALYNLTATGATQLSFTEGDIIEGVGEPKDGWQYGENIRTAKAGWFPSNYVEKQQAPRPTSAARPSVSGSDLAKPNIPQPDYANRSPASPPPPN